MILCKTFIFRIFDNYISIDIDTDGYSKHSLYLEINLTGDESTNRPD